MRNLMTILQGF